MILIILPGNAGLARHKRKFRNNIEIPIELSFRAGELLHHVPSCISAGLPGHGSNDSKAIRPNLLQGRRIEVLKTLRRSLIRNKIIKLQSKDDGMIMRTKRLRTILARSEEANTFTKLLSKTLHEKLKITLHERHTRQGLASLGVGIVVNRNMSIIISKRYKITGLVIFKLQHTSVSPFTRTLETTAGTLSARNLNELRNITETAISRMYATSKAITRTLEMVYLIARHLKQPFAVFFT